MRTLPTALLTTAPAPVLRRRTPGVRLSSSRVASAPATAAIQAIVWSRLTSVSSTAVVISIVGAPGDRRSRPENRPKTTGIRSRVPLVEMPSGPPSIDQASSATRTWYAQRAVGSPTPRSGARPRSRPPTHRSRRFPVRDRERAPSVSGRLAVATIVVGRVAAGSAGGSVQGIRTDTDSGLCRLRRSGAYHELVGLAAGRARGGQLNEERTSVAGPMLPTTAAASETAASTSAIRALDLDLVVAAGGSPATAPSAIDSHPSHGPDRRRAHDIAALRRPRPQGSRGERRGRRRPDDGRRPAGPSSPTANLRASPTSAVRRSDGRRDETR